jgi:hypothetical protein
MLPNGISRDRILEILWFLSPVIVILHGSRASNKRFSAKEKSDLDLICVSMKAPFWPLDQLYERVKEDSKREDCQIDLSIVSSKEFSSVVKGKSSLGESLSHGFSILYFEGGL